MAVTSTGYQLNKQPIAQSFYVDEPNGIYVTKVDLFFATRDTKTSLPVQIQIRPMENGVPSSSEIIPGSQVVLPSSSINNDLEGPDLTPTSFTFEEPVFLRGELDYALIVTADSKDYQIFIAEINEFTYGSTEKRVNKQPISGSLFYSQNGATFTPAQNQDLAFVLHRAQFKHTTASVRLKNAAVPKKLLTADPIKTTSGSTTIQITHLNHGLQVGDTVVISGATAVGGISAANINGSRSIIKRDFTGYTVAAGATATTTNRGGGNLIQCTKNILYNTMYPHAAMIEPKGTIVTAAAKYTTARSFSGSETAFQKSTDFTNIKLNQNNERRILSLVANETSETAELGSGVKSFEININLTAPENTVAPMLDLQRASASLINSIIDRQTDSADALNFVSETSRFGSHAAKHLTRIINLESDSVGLRVYLEANVPTTCDFELYYRTATGDENINEKNYAIATQENTLPKDDNRFIFREYRYLIGGQGGFLPAFTKFQLKIVMRSTNQAEVPRFQSLRAIALSV
jgi:hypothetical protein